MGAWALACRIPTETILRRGWVSPGLHRRLGRFAPEPASSTPLKLATRGSTWLATSPVSSRQSAPPIFRWSLWKTSSRRIQALAKLQPPDSIPQLTIPQGWANDQNIRDSFTFQYLV